MIIMQAFWLIALWIRLVWRVKQEDARRRYIVAVVQALPKYGRISEQRADGSHLKLDVTPSGNDVNDHGRP